MLNIEKLDNSIVMCILDLYYDDEAILQRKKKTASTNTHVLQESCTP